MRRCGFRMAAAVALATLLLPGGGCGAEDCGTAANGAACTQDADCTCDHACSEGVCVRTLSVEEPALTAAMAAYCRDYAALPCGDWPGLVEDAGLSTAS